MREVMQIYKLVLMGIHSTDQFKETTLGLYNFDQNYVMPLNITEFIFYLYRKFIYVRTIG